MNEELENEEIENEETFAEKLIEHIELTIYEIDDVTAEYSEALEESEIESLTGDLYDQANVYLEEYGSQSFEKLISSYYDRYVMKLLLYNAIKHKNEIMIQSLFSAVISPDIIKDSEWLLDLAVRYVDELKLIRFLLLKGIHPDESYKCLLFDLAESPQRVDIAHLLIMYGAPAKNARCYDTTLLHYYVRKGDYEMVDFLLQLGLDPNSKDNKGNTPLMIASYEDLDIIKDLIKYGTNPNISNLKNNNAFDKFEKMRPYYKYIDEIIAILNRNRNL